MIWVIDTSALVRLFVPDGPIPRGLEDALRSAELGNDALLAPDLMLVEAAQVIHRNRQTGLLTDEEAQSLIEAILSLPLRIAAHADLLLDAFRNAAQQRLTVYDALFLSLAEKNNARLITADAELEEAGRRMGICP